MPPGLEWATRDTGFVDPRRAGDRERITPSCHARGAGRAVSDPDRNLNPYAGTRPVHQAASVTQVRHRKETSPQAAPTSLGRHSMERTTTPARSVRSSSQSISSSAKARLSGWLQNSPIRSARSKSGSSRTWSRSARGAGPRASGRSCSRRSSSSGLSLEAYAPKRDRSHAPGRTLRCAYRRPSCGWSQRGSV